MYFFFSGEGKTDCGTGTHDGYCTGDDYEHGPLTLVADQIVQRKHNYSFLEYNELAVFVDNAELEKIKPMLRPLQRSPELRGKKTPPGSRMHRKDARALARAVKTFMQGKADEAFVAVLFRDFNSDKNSNWQDKRKSMLNGFNDESITGRGVPAVAQPISEAWWLSAIYRKRDSNKNCQYLEATKHGDATDHALKFELAKILGATPSQYELNDFVSDTEQFDYALIDSKSFIAFKEDFETAIGSRSHQHHRKTT